MSRHFLVPVAVLLLLAAAPASAQRKEADAPRGEADLRRGGDDLRRNPIVRAVEQIGPSVVNISAERLVMRRASPLDGFGSSGDRGRRSESLGSGVVLDASGIVVTNDHVISGASKIFVTTADGRELEAELLGADADNDLAVLKVDGKGLKPVRVGTTADLMIGETAIAVGNPFGLSNTVTTGIVSALQRTVKGEGRTYTDFIQTDAAINPGELGRGALQRPRRADRDQHGDRRRREHHRLRDPGRAGPPDRRRPPPFRRGQAGLDRREGNDPHGRPRPPERPRPRDAGPFGLPLLPRRSRGPGAGRRRRLAERKARRIARGLRHAPLRRRARRLR